MDNEQLNKLKDWFDGYSGTFYCGEEDINYNITLKREHTVRVCKNIRELSKSIGLSEDETDLAFITGLFHDVGRFEQFSKYRTFKDAKSVDHAKLGVEIIKANNILKDLDDSDKDIVLKAIEYHNFWYIPEKENGKTLLFSKLIRDADKLDIFEILMEFYENPDNCPYLEIGESTNTGREYSINVINELMSNMNISYLNVKTSVDMSLVRLAWVFDLNFNYSLKIVREKAYIDRIMKTLPQDDNLRMVYNHIVTYVDDKINTT